MPRGDKSSYTAKQKRKAEHIEEGYEDRGVSKDEAERRAGAMKAPGRLYLLLPNGLAEKLDAGRDYPP